MSEFYASAPIEIREDLAAAHARAWDRIGRAGSWWDGGQRVAIAAETRHALSCALCRRRKEAVSPGPIEGKHDSLRALPDTVVEVIHRVRTDPARLSKRWFRGVIVAGFSEEQYVETVSIVAHGRRDRHDGARSGSRPAAAAAAGTRQAVAIPAPRRQAGRCLGPVAGAGGSDRTGGGDLPGRAADGEHHEGDEPGARRGEGLLRCRVAPIPGAIRNARFLA